MKMLIAAVAAMFSLGAFAGENPEMECRNECYTIYLPPECTTVTDALGFKVRICNRDRTKVVCEWVCADPF